MTDKPEIKTNKYNIGDIVYFKRVTYKFGQPEFIKDIKYFRIAKGEIIGISKISKEIRYTLKYIDEEVETYEDEKNVFKSYEEVLEQYSKYFEEVLEQYRKYFELVLEELKKGN